MRIATNRIPRIYYWVLYKLEGGKYGKWGAFHYADKAERWAEDNLKGNVTFEVIPLDTKNPQAASRKLRSHILTDTKDIGLAIQKIRRKEPNNNVNPTQVPTLEQEQSNDEWSL